MKSKPIKKKENVIELVEKTNFSFAYLENANKVAIALCSSGYFVRIVGNSPSYTLLVYQYN